MQTGYGEIVKKIRDELGLSLRQFAELVEISHTHVSRIENEYACKDKDKIRVPIDTLKQICDKTNYDFKKFLEEAGYI